MDKITAEKIRKEKTIDKEIHLEGVLTIVANLVTDLEELLEEEGRFHGAPVRYSNEIHEKFSKILLDGENIETYNEVKYLYKGLINTEFTFLMKRKVTPADCVIIILEKLLEKIVQYKSFKWNSEVKEVKDVVDRFFGNIRNPAKQSKLFCLINGLDELCEMGAVGKRSLEYITVQKEEIVDTPIKSNTKLEIGDGCIKEIKLC